MLRSRSKFNLGASLLCAAWAVGGCSGHVEAIGAQPADAASSSSTLDAASSRRDARVTQVDAVGPTRDARPGSHEDGPVTTTTPEASVTVDAHRADVAASFDAARAREAGADAASVPPCAPGGEGRMLSCSSDCPDSLFATVSLEDDFGPSSTYSQLWTGTYVAPTLGAGGLQFGPHPASADWWNTYSPTTTNETDFGDVMFCARFSFATTAMAVPIPDGGTYADAFQISLRGGSEGMVLSLGGVAETVNLSTKIDSTNTWVTHASLPFDFAPGTHTMELALYGSGSSFYSEVKDVGSGSVVPLQASYALPATGTVGMLGWQLPQALVVTRVAIGTPAPAAAGRIMAP